MELLSPAGNREALVAAIACGADAVYLGYTAFGARSYAGNFDADGLRDAVAYAHERGKKIYVTVNTLVKQCELDDLRDVLDLLSDVRVDAVLVQDMGVARIIQQSYPHLVLHASTQMTINNAQGARLMKDMGFARVVPARECTLDELKKMADVGVEVEAFAHGALCVAVSGQCLFSSMIGGRSGNRGRCAQPCRLPYTLEDGTSGYLLSTKDLMLIDRIPELRDAGVYSFKLEGRMKRPEYVGVITRAYREALDAAEAHVSYHPSQAVIEGLRQVFNRGGFTEGYVMEKSNAALMSWEKPNHWGISIGKIMSMRGALAQVRLTKALNDGDGLQSRGRQETEFTYSGNDVPAGAEATVRIAAGQARVGDEIFRLTDAAQMQQVVSNLEATPGIVKVRADEAISNGFLTVRNVASLISIALIAVLLVISVFIISNTIKLTTFDRREEIAIMRMVGATNGFIRWPFVYEGLLIGLMGAVIAFGLQWLLYEAISKGIAGSDTLQLLRVVSFRKIWGPVAGVFGLVGILVGVGGSLTAIRKFLRV